MTRRTFTQAEHDAAYRRSRERSPWASAYHQAKGDRLYGRKKSLYIPTHWTGDQADGYRWGWRHAKPTRRASGDPLGRDV